MAVISTSTMTKRSDLAQLVVASSLIYQSKLRPSASRATSKSERFGYVPNVIVLVCQIAQPAHSDDLKLGEMTATQQ